MLHSNFLVAADDYNIKRIPTLLQSYLKTANPQHMPHILLPL